MWMVLKSHLIRSFRAGSVNTVTTNDVRIGTSLQGISDFNGSIDDVRIYDTDLTAAQILELYKQGDSLTPNGDIISKQELARKGVIIYV